MAAAEAEAWAAEGEGEWQEEGAGEEFEDEDIDERVVIIDNGSGVCKAGLSTDKAPTHIFPEIIARPRKSHQGKGGLRDVYFGDEVTPELRSKLAVSHPLENGVIEDFDSMELLWEYTFKKLDVEPCRHPVLLTEPPYNAKPNREQMVEIMFEVFQVPSLNISIQGVLALLGQGRTTGLVLDSGDGVTHCVPIFDGFGLPHCINRLDLAGRELNTLMAKLLAMEKKCRLTTTEGFHCARQMKEQHCYVALDPSNEFGEPVDVRVPGGQTVQLTDERWKCPEALFNPGMVGLECMGVGGLVWDSISRCDLDVRKTLLSNVVLSGGSTMFPGFSERLTKELKSYAPAAAQSDIRVLKSKDQTTAVWAGGHVFASLRSIQEDAWMTIEDYEEYGASLMHEKIAVKYN